MSGKIEKKIEKKVRFLFGLFAEYCIKCKSWVRTNLSLVYLLNYLKSSWLGFRNCTERINVARRKRKE